MPYLNKPKKVKNTSIKRSERNEIYQTSKWKQLRLSKLQQQPLCEICQSKGITKLAVDVHHIVSFMSTNDYLQRLHLAFDPDNLMSLCKECHQEIHNSVTPFK